MRRWRPLPCSSQDSGLTTYLPSIAQSQFIVVTITSCGCVVAVCDLHQRQGDDADISLRPSSRLPEVLRQDYPNRCIATSASTQMRYMQSQDFKTQDWSDFAIVSERLLGELQVFLSATVGQSVQRQQRQLVDIFHVVFFREQRWLPISRRGRHGRLLYQRALSWWRLSTATHRSTSSLATTCDEDETAGVLQEWQKWSSCQSPAADQGNQHC